MKTQQLGPVKSLLYALLAIVLALPLGGCVRDKTIQDLLAPGKGKMVADVSVKGSHGGHKLVLIGSYKPKFLSQGVITQHGSKFTGKGARAVGTLGFHLAKPDAAVKKAFGEFAKGDWRSTFDFYGDSATGNATATGVEIVTFKTHKAGAICISATVQYRAHGKKITNSFRTLGGTGDGASIHASGTYSRTQKPNGKVAVNAHVQASRGKSVPFTKACGQLNNSK